jgi:hypothetical protein
MPNWFLPWNFATRQKLRSRLTHEEITADLSASVNWIVSKIATNVFASNLLALSEPNQNFPIRFAVPASEWQPESSLLLRPDILLSSTLIPLDALKSKRIPKNYQPSELPSSNS